MDELFKNSNTQNMFAQLGTRVGNDYVPSKNCYMILMHIYEKLNSSERSATHLRQIIGFSQLLSQHLIPMFIAVNNDNIIDILLKILVSLISPIESLMLVGENGDNSVLLGLNWMMSMSKAAWANLKAIKRIMEIIKEHMKKLSNCPAGCTNNYSISSISDCLRLIKNILHIPNEQYENTILWMFFSEQFDEIIISLIANSNRGHWAVLIIELIALIFKNQHVEQMSKQFIKMNETKKFDSSEDNESNSSSKYPKHGRHSSPEHLSELSNKDSDNDTNFKLNKIIGNLRKNNLMDEEDRSSKEAIIHSLNVHTIKDKLDSPKTKFEELFQGDDVKTSNSNNFNKVSRRNSYTETRRNSNRESRRNSLEQIKFEFEMKSYKPTLGSAILRRKKYIKKNSKTKLKLPLFPKQFNVPRETYMISYFLQKFTVCFLQNGFNTLVDELYNLLTSNSHIDTSLYFWILTYFCRFCKLNNIKLELVRQIVSFKLISFIVHEGLKISEELRIAKLQKSPNIHLKVRHLHLAIMAIKEVIKTIEFYRQTAVESPIYAHLIKDLQNSGNTSPESITWAKDIKSLFTLLIRYYDSDIQIIEYLHDLIVTNHMVLSLFDAFKDYWNLNDNITAYIEKFAVPDTMYKYGLVLQNYEKNSDIVNESVLVMMHHVITKVENTTSLFQPIILKTFLNIFEKNDYMYKRWSDLIKNVLNKFLNIPHTLDCSENTLRGLPCIYEATNELLNLNNYRNKNKVNLLDTTNM
ncbi:protein timeless isoform X1 [Acyrthosiphon pisum]|uniref:Timeless N-terminal domain-containing protein n=1 Tax=Acyrthosiphon pisum TaxID=7029 RepID=A0A8R2JL39_ACYPI|nr:protein timeless isoform X1 [Acyrthosiphon pisum]